MIRLNVLRTAVQSIMRDTLGDGMKSDIGYKGLGQCFCASIHLVPLLVHITASCGGRHEAFSYRLFEFPELGGHLAYPSEATNDKAPSASAIHILTDFRRRTCKFFFTPDS